METGYLNFHDEEHFSEFSLSLGQDNLLGDSENSLLQEDDYCYATCNPGSETCSSLWGTEQELNGDLAVLPVSGVASDIPAIESIKEDFAKVLTDWQDHIGLLQASDMGEDIDMDELSLTIPTADNPILDTNIVDEKIPIVLSSTPEKRQRDPTNSHSPKSKAILETSTHSDIDIIGLDSSAIEIPDIEELIDSDEETSETINDIDYELLDAANGRKDFDLAAFIGQDDFAEVVDEDVPPVIVPKTNQPRKAKKARRKEENQKQFGLGCGKRMDVLVRTLKMHPEKFERPRKSSDNEECVDVETVSNRRQVPVLEAGDVKSLLEQFEATEASVKLPTSSGSRAKKESPAAAGELPSKKADRFNQSLLKKSVEKKDSKSYKNICDTLPKEVIDRIKASASASVRKKDIHVILTHPNSKQTPRKGGIKAQDSAGAAETSNPKRVKGVAIPNVESTGHIDDSIQLDHSYCTSPTKNYEKPQNSRNSKKNLDKPIPPTIKKSPPTTTNSVSFPTKNSKNSCETTEKKIESSTELNSQSLKINSQTSEIKRSRTMITGAVNNKISPPKNEPAYEMKIRSALAKTIMKAGKINASKNLGTVNDSKSTNVPQRPAMVSLLKNRSQLATSTGVQSPNSIPCNKNSKTTVVEERKSPPESEQEQEQEDPSGKVEKKPVPRRKLNLAEYRSRREMSRSDKDGASSPMPMVQPMTLLYIHHVATSTEPITINDPQNPVWCEREIVSVLKIKTELEEAKTKKKAECREIATQTNETVFNCPARIVNEDNETQVIVIAETIELEELENSRVIKIVEAIEPTTKTRNKITRTRGRKNRRSISSRSRSRSISRSSSSSRSRTRSRSRYRSRARSGARRRTRSRSRRTRRRSVSRSRSKHSQRSQSRTRRCSISSNPRRRRFSHRRSSVSSSSSWSSRSRSYARSYSGSASPRSRTPRSNTSRRSSSPRSRSSSRFSSCSRYTSRLNSGRNRWSGETRSGRKRRGNRRRNYDRHRRGSAGSNHGYRRRRSTSRGRSYSRRPQYDSWYQKEKRRQMEERRVIYVGRLGEDVTKADLRRRFEIFGPVVDISVHFREHGDNYGFVTFAYKNDAYEAVEHGNDDPSVPKYDLSFGGRRAFCQVKYADLDGMASNPLTSGVGNSRGLIKCDEENSFDILLKEAQAKIRKRKV